MKGKTNCNTPPNPSFSPELFRYEAFNGGDGGLTTVLHALEKLSRLAALAQRPKQPYWPPGGCRDHLPE